MTSAPELLHRAATRKAMCRLLPVLGLVTFMGAIDRGNVAIARPDLAAEFGPTAYGLGAVLFLLGYALLPVPSNLALHRVGARRWIALLLVAGGSVSAATALVSGATSFYFFRLLLGVAEAGLFPAVMYLVTRWFSPRHRATVVGLIYTAPCLAVLAGPPLGDLLTGLGGWPVMFLAEGLATIAVGALVWFILPGRPAEAGWLSGPEAAILSERADGGNLPQPWGYREVLRLALTRPFVPLVAALFLINQLVGSGVGLSSFEPDGRSSPLPVGLLGGAGMAGVLVFPWLKNRFGHEIALIGIGVVAGPLVLLGLVASGDAGPSAWLAGTAALVSLGTQPLLWSVAMSRMSGPVAATGLAFIAMIGSAGDLLGTHAYAFITGGAAAPYYALGVAFLALALIPALGLAIRRDRWYDHAARPAAAMPVAWSRGHLVR
jgi:MFS family permease